MSVKSLLVASIVMFSLGGQSSAQNPICLHFSGDTDTCNDWYGPPVASTTCFDTPCVGEYCLRPWESAPIMQNYDIPFDVATEPQQGQSKHESQLNSFPCYRSHPCTACWFHEGHQTFYCGVDLNNPGTFFWWVLFYEDMGKCPPIFTSIQDLNDKVS